MFEFLAFVGVIILFFYTKSISERVARLEKHIASGAVAPRPVSAAATPEQPASVSPKPVAAQPFPAPSHPAAENAFSRDLNQITANQWLTGIGVLALVFGIGFFLKYAIDQDWISEPVRVLLGVVVGLLLISLGELWRAKYTKYAQALTGGGLAILYFSIFAAYQFYQLLSQPIAFLCMVLITISGVALSFRYNSKVLTVLAVLGGYLSPLLISSHVDRQVALFMYITLLNVGVLAMMYKKFWIEPLFVALVGTTIVFSAWASGYSNYSNTLNSVGFLIINFILINLILAVLFRKLHENGQLDPDTPTHVGIYGLLQGFFIFLGVTFLLESRFHDYLAPILFLLGVTQFLAYALVDRLEHARLNYFWSFVGAGFLVAACSWQFSGTTLDLYLIVLALIGIVTGIGVHRKDLRVWGLVLLLITTLKTIGEAYNDETYQLLFNAKFGAELAAILAAVFVERLYSKFITDGDEKQVGDVFRVIAAGVVWFAISWEIVMYFQGYELSNTRNLSLSVWWMAYAVVLALGGIFKTYAVLRKMSVLLFGLTILKVFLYDVQALDLGYRIVSFIALGIILLAVSFAYQKNKEKIKAFLEGSTNGSTPTS